MSPHPQEARSRIDRASGGWAGGGSRAVTRHVGVGEARQTRLVPGGGPASPPPPSEGGDAHQGGAGGHVFSGGYVRQDVERHQRDAGQGRRSPRAEASPIEKAPPIAPH